jgi:hypothetical protein
MEWKESSIAISDKLVPNNSEVVLGMSLKISTVKFPRFLLQKAPVSRIPAELSTRFSISTSCESCSTLISIHPNKNQPRNSETTSDFS